MRLAIIISHPIQYYAPWFRFMAASGKLDLKVFFLWDGGANSRLDAGFGINVQWDIPFLEGYAHEFVPNRSRNAGTGRVFGLNNPALAGRVTAFKPDAVLLFGYNYMSLYRFLLSPLARKTPLLFRGDSHRLVPRPGLKQVLRKRWIRAVFSRFSAFLYVGQANRAYFSLHGVPDRKLFFCPHCVDNERFFSAARHARQAAAEWKKELGIEPSRRVVLYAGKFEAKKMPGDLIQAFKRAALKNTALVFVGDGKLGPDLRKSSSGDSNIVFAPFQNQTQMPRAYALADLFVLPSYGNEETWGLSVNEALCMGCPVIVSDHVGCARDLVRPFRNGLVFPAGDIAALANVLREAFSDPGRLRAWGAHGRDIVKNYSYQQATRGLIAGLGFVAGTARAVSGSAAQ